MSDGGSWVEIVLLAMLAAFIGLRLVSVLGKRTGSERPVGDAFRPTPPEITAPPQRGSEPATRAELALPPGTDEALAVDLRRLADADAGFQPERFLAGARSAYRLILEAFWAGDARAMDGLVSDEVQDNFAAAIAARDGRRLSNRLDSITDARITAAVLNGQMAEVTVRFVARIVGGDDNADTVDVWTFSRHVGSRDPNWLLIATDDEA